MAGSQKREGKERAGHRDAQHRAEQFVGVLNLLDVVLTACVKSRGRNDENCRVDEQREHQGGGGVNGGKLDGLGLAFGGLLVFARLHNRGVQVKIVRHDRRAENAYRDVKHFLVLHDFKPGHESTENLGDVRSGKNDFRQEAAANR